MKILKVKGHLIKKNKINKNISLFDVNDCLYNIFTYLFFIHLIIIVIKIALKYEVLLSSHF